MIIAQLAELALQLPNLIVDKQLHIFQILGLAK
jgi:hypothetical protein